MPNAAGTLETLPLKLGSALKPLRELPGPQIFERLGVELPREISGDAMLQMKLSAAAAKAAQLEPRLAKLAAEISSENDASIITSGVTLIAKVTEFATSLAEVRPPSNPAP